MHSGLALGTQFRFLRLPSMRHSILEKYAPLQQFVNCAINLDHMFLYWVIIHCGRTADLDWLLQVMDLDWLLQVMGTWR